jgi:hypothetical protein
MGFGVFVFLFGLEIEGVGHRGENGEDGELYKGAAVALVRILPTGVGEIGVLVVIEIVDADVDGTVEWLAFELTVEVHTHIGTVVIGHAEVVAAVDVRE